MKIRSCDTGWFPCIVAVALLCISCTSIAATAAELYPDPPEWAANKTMYEVNLRQFSDTGNVDGLVKQLPRLKQMGVGILWIMPVNPIGVEGRAGTLGSPYAVSDYSKFNPEFGTIDQFKSMVDDAHKSGMYVILDWVAVHTSMDNVWVKQHPDWYKHDSDGQLVHPAPEWKDVVALNYDNADLRKAMIDAMSMWIKTTGIDGFRCDTAEWLPLDFWSAARDSLRKIKPVFMLAEGNKPELVKYAFDAAYAWNLSPNMEGIVKGTKTPADLTNFFKAEAGLLGNSGFRLNFTTNHDKNSWEGTTKEQLDGGVNAFTVLTFTAPGMPLIYNGQETANEKRLQFFEHDPIEWRDDPMADLYRKLALLKRTNRALWNGAEIAPLQFIDYSSNPSVLAYHRDSHGNQIVVLLNLGPQPISVSAPAESKALQTVISDAATPDPAGEINLQPWGYRVWSNVR